MMVSAVPWSRRYCIIIFNLVFRTADTITVRLILAWASIGYSLLLLWPHAVNALHLTEVPVRTYFQRHTYQLMAVIASDWCWAAAFMLHGIGVHWRILDPKERVHWGLAVNILGVLIWAYSTASVNIAWSNIGPTTALEWTMVVASGWALYRTGLTKELVSA